MREAVWVALWSDKFLRVFFFSPYLCICTCAETWQTPCLWPLLLLLFFFCCCCSRNCRDRDCSGETQALFQLIWQKPASKQLHLHSMSREEESPSQSYAFTSHVSILAPFWSPPTRPENMGLLKGALSWFCMWGLSLGHRTMSLTWSCNSLLHGFSTFRTPSLKRGAVFL